MLSCTEDVCNVDIILEMRRMLTYGSIVRWQALSKTYYIIQYNQAQLELKNHVRRCYWAL